MKVRKPWAILIAAVILAATVTGCATPGGASSQPTQTPPVSNPPQTDNTTEKADSSTYTFTDSVGRQVVLPKDIERIAPSGSLAQIVLFTLCPDKIVGLANSFTDDQLQYMDPKYGDLPVFGDFYADTLNLETVMQADPQVIIDIGQTMPSEADDMDSVQAKTGIPAIFINMDMDTILQAYETLGGVTGETEQAGKLTDYIGATLSDAKQKAASIPDADRVKVYYGQDDGLTGIVNGTIHSDVIDMAGGINVVDVDESVKGGAASVSMEQLMLWQPDAILFAPGSIYGDVGTRSEWSGLGAVKDGKYYEIPFGPYNWMGRPPSVNRIIGVKWLGNLLYPDVFNYDMRAETKTFYKLFYGCDVTDAQITALLANSTFKQ